MNTHQSLHLQEKFYQEELEYRQQQDSIPNFNVELSVREVHALLNYMDSVFEHKGIEDFLEGMGIGDDECWDIEATKSVYNKLLDCSNYCFEEGFLSV
tara:strand:+ start:64 stop:357 length:294 start_codon:yes stop_codon:yes gene_type:complete